MLRSLLARLASFARDDERENGDESGSFVPSRLDASVLFAHGADVDRVEDELGEVEAQAEELEEARRRR